MVFLTEKHKPSPVLGSPIIDDPQSSQLPLQMQIKPGVYPEEQHLHTNTTGKTLNLESGFTPAAQTLVTCGVSPASAPPARAHKWPRAFWPSVYTRYANTPTASAPSPHTAEEKHALAAVNHNNITEMNVNVQTHFRQSLLEHAVHDGHQFGRDLCDVIVVVLERESETDVSSSHQRVRLVDT